MTRKPNPAEEMLRAAIEASDTPTWARAMLLIIRDDHQLLHQHLEEHHDMMRSMNQVLLTAIAAIVVTLAFWLLAGRLPYIFGYILGS